MTTLLGPYKFYKSTITLWFDKESHTYLRELACGDGSTSNFPVDGVTNSVHIIDKSFALTPWAAKKVTERVLTLIPTEAVPFEVERYTKPISETELKDILYKAKNAPKEIKEDAGDLGTLAHNCLEDSINAALNAFGEETEVTRIINWPTDERSVNCVKAAFDWMQQHNVRWLHTEKKVYSQIHDYAGTMDGLAVVDSCDNKNCCVVKSKDVLSLIDWKSSNGLWVEYLYQTAAYQFAYEEEMDSGISDRWILRLGKEDGKFEPWHLGPEDYEMDIKGFIQCLELSRTHKAVKDRMAKLMKEASARRRAEKKLLTKR